MNRYFMLLNDNTIEVTNEEGIEINRGEFENNNVKGILLAENKVEITENFKKVFDRELFENKKFLKLSISMLKLQGVLTIAIPVFGFLHGAISNPNTWIIDRILESVSACSGAIIPIAISTIYWSVVIAIYKKNIKKFTALINKGEVLKKESERELTTEKNKIFANTLEPLVKVSLEEETDIIAKQMSEELIKYHQENIKQRAKVKIKKR